jgi:hypothetical protein
MGRPHHFQISMAEKRSKSILSGLKNMLHRESDKLSQPAPKHSGSAPRKPASAEKRATPARNAEQRRPVAPPAEAAPAPDAAAEPKPDRKKTQNQPWYRHRQRW